MNHSALIVGLKNVSTTLGGLIGALGAVAIALDYGEWGEMMIGAGVLVTGVFARSAGTSSKSLGIQE